MDQIQDFDYNDADDLLIASVKRFPCLYDKKNPDFRRKKTKENAWKVIGNAINMDAKLANTRWLSIRNQYTRWKRIVAAKTSEEADGCKTRFMFAELMTWLDPYVVKRKIWPKVVRRAIASNSTTPQIVECTSINLESIPGIATPELSEDASSHEKHTCIDSSPTTSVPVSAQASMQYEERPDHFHLLKRKKLDSFESLFSTTMSTLNTQLNTLSNTPTPRVDTYTDQAGLFANIVAETLRRLSRTDRWTCTFEIMNVLRKFDNDTDE